jgi:hypothetical protein
VRPAGTALKANGLFAKLVSSVLPDHQYRPHVYVERTQIKMANLSAPSAMAAATRIVKAKSIVRRVFQATTAPTKECSLQSRVEKGHTSRIPVKLCVFSAVVASSKRGMDKQAVMVVPLVTTAQTTACLCQLHVGKAHINLMQAKLCVFHVPVGNSRTT